MLLWFLVVSRKRRLRRPRLRRDDSQAGELARLQVRRRWVFWLLCEAALSIRDVGIDTLSFTPFFLSLNCVIILCVFNLYDFAKSPSTRLPLSRASPRFRPRSLQLQFLALYVQQTLFASSSRGQQEASTFRVNNKQQHSSGQNTVSAVQNKVLPSFHGSRSRYRPTELYRGKIAQVLYLICIAVARLRSAWIGRHTAWAEYFMPKSNRIGNEDKLPRYWL